MTRLHTAAMINASMHTKSPGARAKATRGWRMMLYASAMAVFALGSHVLQAQTPPVTQTAADSLDPYMVPAGFGSLRQDDVTMRVSLTGGLQARATPLDEKVIRLLSPDSYTSLRTISDSKRKEIAAVKDRAGVQSVSIWYVSYYATEQGETRFSPQEFVITSSGRDYRPLDIVPLTPNFGEYRLKQRQTQSALYVFDGQIDTNQQLVVQMEGMRASPDWGSIVSRFDRERSLIRSRAGAKK